MCRRPRPLPAATFDYTPRQDQPQRLQLHEPARPGRSPWPTSSPPGSSSWGPWAIRRRATAGWRWSSPAAAGQSAAFSVQRNLPGSDYFQDGRTDPAWTSSSPGLQRTGESPNSWTRPRASSAARGRTGGSWMTSVARRARRRRHAGLAACAARAHRRQEAATRRGRPSSSNLAPGAELDEPHGPGSRASASASWPAPSPRAALEERCRG